MYAPPWNNKDLFRDLFSRRVRKLNPSPTLFFRLGDRCGAEELSVVSPRDVTKPLRGEKENGLPSEAAAQVSLLFDRVGLVDGARGKGGEAGKTSK